jgi:serine protease Do
VPFLSPVTCPQGQYLIKSGVVEVMRVLGIRIQRVITCVALATVALGFSVASNAASLPDFTLLVESSSPAVVNISTSQKRSRTLKLPKGMELPEGFDIPKDSPFYDYFQRYFGERAPDEFESQSLGSGFIISSDGYIISNSHVVRDADQIVVRLSDRREFEAKVVGSDERSDIALLKIDSTALPVVKLGTSANLKVGEWVLAIGSPFGFDYSVTAGIVSAKGRALPRENYVPFIQTDVAINPGNSGGPLFNLAGEVVGVNSQIFSRTGGFMGLSFAVPIDMAMNVANQLRSKGSVSRGWLGVLIQDVTGELAESFGMLKPQGALVAKVLDGSPAEHGGILVGDIVLTYNGQHVTRSSDLPPIVGASPAGQPAKVEVLRSTPTGAKPVTLSVVTGELPEEGQVASKAAPPAPPANTAKALGATVGTLAKGERESLGVKGQGGVIVRAVGSGPLQAAGIKQGDVILTLNHVPVRDAAHFAEQAKALPKGKHVPLYIVRDAEPSFLPLKIDP